MTRAVECVDQAGAPANEPLCQGLRPVAAQRCGLIPCGGACRAGCSHGGSCAPDGSCSCPAGRSGLFCQVLGEGASCNALLALLGTKMLSRAASDGSYRKCSVYGCKGASWVGEQGGCRSTGDSWCQAGAPGVREQCD